MSEAVTIPGPPDLVKWQGMSIEAERIAEIIEITTDEEHGMAVDSLSRIKSFQKSVTAAKDEALDPFKILVNRVRAMFKPIEDSLEAAEVKIKAKQKAFIVERERIREEENRKRLAEHVAKVKAEQDKAAAEKRDAKIVAPPPVVMSAPATTRGDVGLANARKFWNYEVTDIGLLARERPELVKMEAKRREILEVIKVNQSVPGLRVYEDIQVTAR